MDFSMFVVNNLTDLSRITSDLINLSIKYLIDKYWAKQAENSKHFELQHLNLLNQVAIHLFEGSDNLSEVSNQPHTWVNNDFFFMFFKISHNLHYRTHVKSKFTLTLRPVDIIIIAIT